MIDVLLRRRRLILAVAGAATLAGVVAALLLPPKYTSDTTFVPEVGTQGLPTELANLAGQFGVSVTGRSPTSPRFFADVLKSRGMLDHVLQTRFSESGENPGDSLPLLSLLEIDGDNARDSLEHGREELQDRISTRVDAETSAITLSVTMEDRRLAADVANTLVRYLGEFNTQTRQSKARAQRAFIEARVQAAAADLREAEDRLRSFYEANRRWEQAPQLVFREGQLRRRVDLMQDLYVTLSREYEKARIEEVNDTPVLTIVDRAVPLEEPSSPGVLLLGGMALVLGLFLGIGLAVTLEFLARLRAVDPIGYSRVRSLLPSGRTAGI